MSSTGLPATGLRPRSPASLFALHAAGAGGALFLADAVRCVATGARWRLPVADFAGALFATAGLVGLLAAAAALLSGLVAPRGSPSSAARLWTFAFLLGGGTLLVYANRASSLFKPLLHLRWAITNAALLALLLGLWLGIGRRRFAPRAAPAGTPSRAARLALAGWPVVWAVLAFLSRPAPRPALSPQPDVVLVVLDTLRADRCSPYGGPPGATPNLDRLAAQGALFARAIAPAPWTVPSHGSLFTGLPARTHGVGMTRLRLPAETETLAEALGRRGYGTAAFTGNPLVSPRLGLARGFEVFFDSSRWNLSRPIVSEASARIHRRLFDRIRQGGVDKYGALLLDALDQWLAGNAAPDRPVFVFLNLLEAHSPHGAPGPRDPSADPLARYDAGVRYVDRLVGRLLTILERRRSLDRALLVVTADHGESLGEEGFTGHAGAPLAATARVPLLLRGPAGIPGGTRVERPVSLVQVAPTVLTFLDGIPREGDLFDPAGLDPVVCEYAPWQGFLREDQPRSHRGLYAEGSGASAVLEWPRAASGPGAPLERGEGPGLAALLERLRAWDAATPRAEPLAGEEVDPEFMEDLEALGYAGRRSEPR